MENIEYESSTTGTIRKAKIILPEAYSADRSYPVLYLLHGIGGDETEWLECEPEDLIKSLVAAGEAKEMIVVLPNVRAGAEDAVNPENIFTMEHFKAFDNFINDLRDNLMPYVEANYSAAVGREHTAIAGLSMGGRESLYIGFSMPETFGYIGAFCPAPGILAYTRNGVSEDGLFAEETFTLPEEYKNHTYVMIVKGKSDAVVGEHPYLYHQTLEANGIEHTYLEMEGGHDFAVWKISLNNFVKKIF